MSAPVPPSDPTPNPATAPGAGNALLWVLLALAIGLRVAHPRPLPELLAMVDAPTLGALAGLLAITQGVERSGVLQCAAARVLGRFHDQRRLALALVAAAAVASALLTNDVSLFLLIPLTRVLAERAHLPLARLVVLQALAVNAGSALTPIGNPQNLYLWHRSGESFLGFMAMMAPAVAIMLGWLAVVVWLLVPATPIEARAAVPAMATATTTTTTITITTTALRPRLLALSALLLVAFVAALERRWLLPGLALVFGAYLTVDARVLRGVDWTLLLIITLMFVVLRQATALPAVAALLSAAPVAEGWRAYLAAVLASQAISNVPAAILLDGPVRDLPALAAGVGVGGFGFVLGSLANLIALRLARLPDGLRAFHRISLPFLLVCGVSVGAWVVWR